MFAISATRCSIPYGTACHMPGKGACPAVVPPQAPSGAPETRCGLQLKRATMYPADYVDTFVTRFPDVQVRSDRWSLAEYTKIRFIGLHANAGRFLH